MTHYFTTKAGRFKLIASLEGLSFLVLIGVAVPLKYLWGQPWLVQNMGLIHGILFILYLFQIIQNKIEFGWATRRTLLAMLLSMVPFGTFYVVRNMIPAIPEATDTKAR